MKNITLFNQVNLLQSFCKRMATASTSCAHSYKRQYLLLTILLFVGVNNAWAGHGFFTDNACGIKLNYSGSTTSEIKQNSSGASTYALKTVSKLYLKGWWLAAWENTNDFNGSEKGILYYKVYLDGNPSSSVTSKNHTYYNWGGWSNGSQNVWLGDDGLNINILDGLVGGNYIFEYYFTMGSEYLSNGSNNYKISFTYNPTFTVSVKAGTGGTVAASSVTAGNINAVTLPKATPNAGYSFLNWEVTTGDITLSNEISASTATVTARSAGTVTASFKANQYTVTLDNQGATTPGAAEVIATYKAAMPSIADKLPAKTGYDFGGYWTVAGGTGTKYYNGTGSSAKYWDIPNNTTLYAKWTAHEYTVHFNANGGEGTMEDQSFTYDVEKVLSPNSFNRTGYTFAGWATSAKGSVVYGDQQPVKNLSAAKNGNITLYAQWTPNTYTVQFNANGGEGSMDNQEFIYDETKNLSKNIFSKEGCIFTGWDTAADGSGTSYTDQQSVSNLVTEGTITLYAQWSTANCKWLETTTIEDGDEVVITMCKGEFTWIISNTSNASTAPTAYDVSSNIDGICLNTVADSYKWVIEKNNDNLTFYSYTDKTNYLYCTNADNGVRVGTGDAKVFVVDGNYLKNTQTNSPRYIGVSLNTNPYSWRCYTTNDGVIKGQTLKLYKKVCLNENNFWVTWNAGEGQFEDGKSTKIEHYQVGAEITPPTPTRKGYNLTWNPTPEATMLAQNMTYTALWTLKTTTITLSPQGGTDGTEFVKATYSQNMPEITPPTLTGYNFQGYFSSNGGTGTKYYNADGTSATTWDREEEEFTLIAYWEAKTTTVSFDQNGGTGGQTSNLTATYDEAMPTLITVPTKEGHTFLGYYDATTDGTQYYDAAGNSTQKWNKEDATFTLYAQWKVNQYTVTWNANEGNWHGEETIQEVTYDYGTTIAKPENPVRAGWVFKGWTTDRSNIVEPAKTMPANNLEYFALWGEAYCENQYTFHTGTSNVWNKPTTQHCFERKEGTETEWQIENYVIPAGEDHTHFLVAYSGWPQRDQGSLGGHSKSVTSTWSETMYLAPAMNFESAANTPKVGHAAGAKGTLRIFDDSSWDNLCVGFIPNGYGITITGDTKKSSHAFHKTTTNQMWETDVVTLPGVTNHKYAMGLATETEGTFVACDHTKAAENIEKMGVTGNVVYLKAEANWTDAGARFAACFMNSDKSEQTWVDMNKIQLQNAENLYIATVPADQKYVIFCRMNGQTTENKWENRWNQTSDIELPTDGLANVYTTTSLVGNSCTYVSAKATPIYQQNGKFRMWDNSNNKNWYVHFVPYYLLSYDANKGEDTMAPTEYNTEDANNKVEVAANEFTRTGYDFVAWNTKADGTGTTYNPSDLFTMTADATIYAIWKAQDYQITYKDQGDEDYSGSNEAELPKTHTYDKATELVNGEKIGYTFDGWYTTSKCDGEPITQLGATEYTTDITLYAKWTFAMEYSITNTETIFITSAVGQKIKATTPLTLEVSNMPVGTTIDISAPHITFYDEEGKSVTQLTTKSNPETFSLAVAYTPEDENTTEQPTITLSVLGNEKTFNIISARSLPQNFVIAAKWGDNWYAMPANMDSQISPEGWLIEVNDKSNPTKAMAAPNTTKYGLRAVHTSNQSADRFAEFGERLVFVENVEEETPVAYKTLYNGGTTTNKTSIQVYAKYENYHTHDANPEHAKRYEWTPSTTDLKDYILTSAIVLSGDAAARTISLDNHGVFGTLLQNKSYNNGMVRLLPVDEFYTPTELQVVEWKANSVSIMYTGAGTKYTTKVGANAESGVQELSAIDHAVYSLSAENLTTATNQPLVITIKNNEETTIGVIKLTIPAIVSGAATSTSLATSTEIAQATDIVVLDDATLTADDTKYTYNDVVVYPGGKLVIDANGNLGMYTLTLRAGSSWGATKYEHKYPEFVLNTKADGAYSNTSGKINLDYVTTKDQYFTFVAPFAVNTKDIKYPVDIYGSNVESANKGSFEFQYYDGAARAEGKTGWTVVPEGDDGADLEAGQGYTFLGMPKKINGNRQKYGIHRIPMKVSATEAQNHETTNQTVPLSVHLSTKNNNSGWNLIGNPYMTRITGLTNNDIQVGKLVHTTDANGNWTGGWHWDDPTTGQRFLVIPSNDGQSYEAVQASNATLPAFKNFFVQISNEGANALSIPVANRVEKSLAPARYAEEQPEKDVEVAIVLEQDEAHVDQMDFLINNIYTEDFERDADFTKMMNATNLNLYGVHPYDNLSFVAIDNNTARGSVAIGYQVPQAGEYILRMSDKPYVMFDKIEALYVTDHEMSPEVTTDIMSEPYRFTVANAETNHTRFTVSVIHKVEEDDGGGDVGTGVDNTTNSNTPCKFIYQDKMYILLNGVIYDAMGKQVQTINK